MRACTLARAHLLVNHNAVWFFIVSHTYDLTNWLNFGSLNVFQKVGYVKIIIFLNNMISKFLYITSFII